MHFGKPHRIRDIVESLEKNTIIEKDENIEDVKKIILKHYDILEELYGKEVRVRVNEIDSKEKIEELLKIL